MIFGWYQKLLMKVPDWLAFPLGACHKCLSGQVALWGYLIVYFKEYNFINHLAFVAGGIFLSVIYNYIWDKCEN
jgi:putative flippase GtrA